MKQPSTEEIARIRALRAEGLTYKAIAQRVGRSEAYCSRISGDVPSPSNRIATNDLRSAIRALQDKARRIRAAETSKHALPTKCKTCRWRMNKAPIPVCCVCWKEVIDRKKSTKSIDNTHYEVANYR